MSNLLLLEDDISLIDGLHYTLKKNGFCIDIARTIEEAEKRLVEIGKYDLLILDVTLPDGTGFEVCEKVIGLAVENGFSVAGLDFSPIKGPEGNIEYLIYLLKSNEPVVYENVDAKQLVYKSHEEL